MRPASSFLQGGQRSHHLDSANDGAKTLVLTTEIGPYSNEAAGLKQLSLPEPGTVTDLSKPRLVR